MTLNGAFEYFSKKTPDKVFIFQKDTAFTYREIYYQVKSLASYLQSIGVVKGDKVCLMLPRTPELVIAFLAASRIGSLPTPANFLLKPASISQFIQRTKPKAIISCGTVMSEKLSEDLNRLPGVVRISAGSDINEWVPWGEVVSYPPASDHHLSRPDDIAYLNFTTGSSGEPKAALATHENLYWNTRSMTELFAMDHDDIHLCMFAPFAHPHELFARALFTGASTVLLQEINPRTIIKTINRHEVTSIMGLAVMFEAMSKHCGQESIESLRIVESGGMYTREETNSGFLKSFGKPIYSVWGSTETSGVAIANSPGAFRVDGSMGKECPHYEIKLMDNGKEVGAGEVGELFFRGPGVVNGYEGDASMLDHDGWFASGDLAKKDQEGFYYFMDRRSGMIKFAGLKIYPLQVENVLLKHPAILEAAVLGVQDRKKGAVPMAYIKVNVSKTDISDILGFCKEYLPQYMVPKGITILDDLPKIGSGKINKKALSEIVNS